MMRHDLPAQAPAPDLHARWRGAPLFLLAAPRQGTGHTHAAIIAKQSGINR
jgi:hypothetical protein